MSGREKLNDRRQAMACTVEWQPRVGAPPQSIELGVGFYPDGRAAEIFVTARKSELDATLADAAVLVSYLLQHGIAAEKIAAAVGRQDPAEGAEIGAPMTPIGAIADLLADLEAERQAAASAPGAALAATTSHTHEVLAALAAQVRPFGTGA